MIISAHQIDFVPLPELYKQPFSPSDEVNSCNPVMLIGVSCTIIAAGRIDIVSNLFLLYFIAEPLAIKRSDSWQLVDMN